MGVAALGLLATVSALILMRTQNGFQPEQARARQLAREEKEMRETLATSPAPRSPPLETSGSGRRLKSVRVCQANWIK